MCGDMYFKRFPEFHCIIMRKILREQVLLLGSRLTGVVELGSETLAFMYHAKLFRARTSK
jgi:hypothetical protein